MFICLIYIIIEAMILANQSISFNFPVQNDQPNLIYLEQYTPNEYQAPFYQLNSNNQLNLSLIQSVQQIYSNQSTTIINNITCVSNYIVESGSTSNVFWMLVNSLELYSGFIDQFGSVSIEKVNIKITANNCFNINLINYDYGILTCQISGNLTFVSVNISSLSAQSYQSSQICAFNNLFTFISIKNTNIYTIYVAGINQNNLLLLSYNLNNNQLSFQNTESFNGTFMQVYSSYNLNYFILLSQNSIVSYTVSLNKTLTILEFQSGYAQNIALNQLSEDIFQLALLSNSFVELYFLNATNGYMHLQSWIILQVPTNVSVFTMNKHNIYIIADSLVAVLQIENNLQEELFSLSISNYLNINLNIQSSIINQDRNLAVIFSTNSTNQQLSTYYFSNPQIPITLNQQNQIVNYSSYLQLNVSVTSQLLKLQPYYFILNLISVDYAISQCPIQTQVNYSTLNIQYPTYTTIPFFNMYQGPFLQPTIQSSNQNYVQVYTNNYESTVSNYQFTQQTYQVLCAYQFAIPIYCTQYQNYSIVISQWFQTQTIVTNPQSNQNLTSCNCFVKETGQITVIMQFQQQIIVQQLHPFFYQGDQNVINFDQQIISSGILLNSLFVITQDNSLYCYDIVKNTSSLSFNYTGQQFQKIYINEESYPNLLFIDNTTNLLILSYNGQNSFEIINQIAYPISDYTSSSFGILQNGIFLSILTTSISQLYYYPKDYIFVQNNQQLFQQVSLFGYSLYGPNIFSSFTQSHFYLVTYTQTNVCCQILIFQGTGSAFTSPTSIQPMQVSTFSTFNVVTKSTADVDVVYYYQANPNSQKSFNFSVPIQASFLLIPYYVNPDLYNITTYVNFTNINCSQSISQNVTIMYQQQMIASIPQQFSLVGHNYTDLYMNPADLFSGNIETLNSTCDNYMYCATSYPIMQRFQPLNISYQAALYFKSNLYVQDNLAVYQAFGNSLTYIQSIPGKKSICSYMFVEILSNFIVSICYQNNQIYFYTFNNTQQQNVNISKNLILPAQFSSANYSNGLLQIVSQNPGNVTNYEAYYIWIVQNTINLQQISQQLNLFYNNEFEFIMLFQSTNFSTQPCQTFGLTSQQQVMNFSIPVFYILQTCMSSTLSQIFGYPGNNYTNNTVEYFTIQNWNIFATLPPFQNQVGCIIQYGTGKQIKEDIIEAQFIVPYQQVAYKYYVLFNLKNGNITSCGKKNSFYITSSYDNNQYQIYQNIFGPLVNVQAYNDTSVNVCVYPITNNNKSDDQIIFSIGCIQFNDFNYSLNRGTFGIYFLMIQQSTQNTVMFQIQNLIKVSLELYGSKTFQLTITAMNQFGQASQIFNITNLDYYEYDEPDVNPHPTDDNTNKDSGNLDYILPVVMVISIIGGWIFIKYYKRNQQPDPLQEDQQNQNQELSGPFYQMR